MKRLLVKVQMAQTRVVAVEMVRSGWILRMFGRWSQENFLAAWMWW